MTSIQTDLARRIRARSSYVFGWGIKVVAVGNGHLRLITHNPRNKRQKAEEVIPIDLDEYAKVADDEDNRDIYIDRIIRNFLFPVRPLQLLEND